MEFRLNNTKTKSISRFKARLLLECCANDKRIWKDFENMILRNATKIIVHFHFDFSSQTALKNSRIAGLLADFLPYLEEKSFVKNRTLISLVFLNEEWIAENIKEVKLRLAKTNMIPNQKTTNPYEKPNDSAQES